MNDEKFLSYPQMSYHLSILSLVFVNETPCALITKTKMQPKYGAKSLKWSASTLDDIDGVKAVFFKRPFRLS